jgi:hypothetical protein
MFALFVPRELLDNLLFQIIHPQKQLPSELASLSSHHTLNFSGLCHQQTKQTALKEAWNKDHRPNLSFFVMIISGSRLSLQLGNEIA